MFADQHGIWLARKALLNAVHALAMIDSCENQPAASVIQKSNAPLAVCGITPAKHAYALHVEQRWLPDTLL